MKKILIITAATIATAAGIASMPSSSDARGFRFGVGFGTAPHATAHRPVKPHVTILRSMERARARAAVRSAAIRAERALSTGTDTIAQTGKRKSLQAKPRHPIPGSHNDEALRRAQLDQQAKAERLARPLGTYDPNSIARPAAAQRLDSAPARIATPVDVTSPRQNVAPMTTPKKKSPSETSCKRFIPGAAITVSVPCD